MKTMQAVLYVLIVFFAGVSMFLPAMASAQPSITSPPPGPLSFADVTFQWNAGGTLVTEWWLWVGPCPDQTYNGCGDDYLNSGSLGLSTSKIVSASIFPTDGSTVYVRLWYKTGGVWQSLLAQYTAAALLQPKITEVHVDLVNKSMHVVGDNIDESLTVTLGDYVDPLFCGNNNSIFCTLPQDILPADYLLRLETIDGKYDEYNLTIAADLTDALCDLASATGSPLPEVCPVKLVFVTSESGTGDLSTWASAGGKTGIEAADNVCNTLADSAGLPGTYVAWLSTFNPEVNAKDRILDARYINRNGDIVADNKADLTDGTLDNPILFDENVFPVGPRKIWTGTYSDGNTFSGGDCNYWLSEGSLGYVGLATSTDVTWTGVGVDLDCFQSTSLYCFEVAN